MAHGIEPRASSSRGRGRAEGGQASAAQHYVATALQHTRQVALCIMITRRALGLGSVSKEQTDSKTLETVNAGLQLSFKISKQMAPVLLTLQW